MKLKPLVKMMLVLPVVLFPTAVTLHASDLSIYKGNTTGKTSILLMLDTSGSMGISSLILPKNNPYGSAGDVTSSLCARTGVNEGGTVINQWSYNAVDKRAGSETLNKTAFKKQVTINKQTISYYLRGCGNPSIDASGKLIETETGKFDRLSRLKDALIQLLADGSIPDTISMGLGHFSAKTPLTIGTTTNKLVDGHSGKILVPNAQLTAAQREKLILELVKLKSVDTTTNEDGTANSNLKLSSTSYPDIFKASSGTPTAHAYAEAAAYMMGTTTGQDPDLPSTSTVLYDGYSVMQNLDDSSKQVYFVCVGLNDNGELSSFSGATVLPCDNQWNNKVMNTWSTKSWRVNTQVNSQARIYKPDGNGGWTQITAQQLHDTAGVGGMNSDWETIEKLPVGYRYGGWLKVASEPMDIEPIGGQVWGSNVGAHNLVSYRSSPFSLKTESVTTTPAICTQTSYAVNRPYSDGNFKACPSGFSVLNAWNSLCYQKGNWTRNATSAEVTAGKCLAPVKGEAPLANARNPDKSWNSNENYNKSTNAYPGGGGLTYKSGSGSAAVPIDNNYGGFAYSASDTKSGANYIAGGSTSSCDGNGIYFLTDGAPNSTKDAMAQTIMNTTLNNVAYNFSAKPSGINVLTSPKLSSDLFAGETGGWEYIGEYAKKLRNRTEQSDTQKNPMNMNIKTAVVGFGAAFAGLTRNSDGSYNCDSATSLDAKNACLWGSKDYGDGGFYFAENAEDIKNSILKFVENVSVDFAASSLGSISVPSDPLDQTRLMTTGFFPMVEPKSDSTLRTWKGNLKKYNIVGGTLKDIAGNAIYHVAGGKQLINQSAKDLWSNEPRLGVDHSLTSSGGAWSKIPTPSLFNIASDPSSIASVRNVFTMDSTSLKRVTTENLATDFVAMKTLPALNMANIDLQKRYALLNYLGYQTEYSSTKNTLTKADINTIIATKPNTPYRYLGGVVHSTPLVVTQKAALKADANTVSSRTEYVVYGSMEGGLHIVDAGTGVEQSVFVPKEILTNQPETLANSDFKITSTVGLAHGVDAPWTADNTFKLETKVDGVTQYIANKMNIYGGLRMGGKAIYGLDILNPKAPKLLFHISPTTTGFERLAQVWSKPTLAEMRVAGVRQKVLIFGGGYDADVYEKEGSAFTEPTVATKGNALYIVNATTGALIKSISASNAGATADQQNVKYSVLGQPTVLDYDSDGLIDMIYFADLGGQIFRVDLNNAAQSTTVNPPDVMVRIKQIADLKETGFVPRFYDRLTAAVFDEGQDRFVLVTAGSGNRSYPLAGTNQPNKIYGVLDYNAATTGLEKTSFTAFSRMATSMSLANRGVLGGTSTSILWGTGGGLTDDKLKAAMGSNGTLRGWRFDLKSVGDVTNDNYAKSFEESQLVKGDLYVNLYDPKTALSGPGNACGGGVQGISTTHRICAPFADCAAYIKTSYEGIAGPALGSTGNLKDSRESSIVGPIVGDTEACIGKCSVDGSALKDQSNILYSKSRQALMTRWFER